MLNDGNVNVNQQSWADQLVCCDWSTAVTWHGLPSAV